MVIDLSSNNGLIDFSTLTGINEVFIRTSLGYGDLDKKLSINANGIANAGIPVSYYHFAYLHASENPILDATQEANYFVDNIQKLPRFTHLAIDLEPENAQGLDTTLSSVDFELWLQTFLDVVENRTGTKCIIYSYADYLNEHLPTGHNFGKYPLWLANYSNISVPPLPKGWTKAFMWQYSESGVIAGIQNKVDLTKLV